MQPTPTAPFLAVAFALALLHAVPRAMAVPVALYTKTGYVESILAHPESLSSPIYSVDFDFSQVQAWAWASEVAAKAAAAAAATGDAVVQEEEEQPSYLFETVFSLPSRDVSAASVVVGQVYFCGQVDERTRPDAITMSGGIAGDGTDGNNFWIQVDQMEQTVTGQMFLDQQNYRFETLDGALVITELARGDGVCSGVEGASGPDEGHGHDHAEASPTPQPTKANKRAERKRARQAEKATRQQKRRERRAAKKKQRGGTRGLAEPTTHDDVDRQLQLAAPPPSDHYLIYFNLGCVPGVFPQWNGGLALSFVPLPSNSTVRSNIARLMDITLEDFSFAKVAVSNQASVYLAHTGRKVQLCLTDTLPFVASNPAATVCGTSKTCCGVAYMNSFTVAANTAWVVGNGRCGPWNNVAVSECLFFWGGGGGGFLLLLLFFGL